MRLSRFFATIALLALAFSVTAFPTSAAIAAPAACPAQINLNFPVTGDTPANASQVTDGGCTTPAFTAQSVTWKTAAGATVSGNFAPATVYTVTLVLALDETQGIDCNSAYSVFPNNVGNLLNTTLVTQAGTSPNVTCTLTPVTFTVTDAAVPSTLGIVAPSATSQSPAFPTSTAYDITTHWYPVGGGAELTPSSTFSANQKYRATVDFGPSSSLTPPTPSMGSVGSGYTCAGLASNWFQVAGSLTATTTVTDYTHCTAEVTFPAFCPAQINLNFPVAGGTPATNSQVTDGGCAAPAFTTSSITWTTAAGAAVTSNFAAGTIYKAAIVLELDSAQGNTCKPTYSVHANNLGGPLTATLSSQSGTSPNIYCNLALVTFPSTDAGVPSALPLLAPAYGQTPLFPTSSAYNITTHWYSVSGGAELDAFTFFTLGASYRATVDFGPKTGSHSTPSLSAVGSGYTCLGIPSNWFHIAGSASITSSYTDYTHCHAEVTFQPTGYRLFSHPNITTQLPVPGQTASSTATDTAATGPDNTEFTATATWKETLTGNPVTTFADDKAYSVRVVITPNPSLSFLSDCSSVLGNYFSIDGYAATNTAGSCVVTLNFPALVPASSLPTVIAPSTGYGPQQSIPSTPQYTGTIAWSGKFAGGKFAGGVIYTAIITLTPNTGYTCAYAEANYYQISGGASTVHGAGSCVLTVTFPVTQKPVPITGAVVNIPAPVYGATAPVTVDGGNQFTANVVWQPAVPNGVFDSTVAYTATITLDPKPGYTCDSVPANSIRVSGAATAINDFSSCVVTAGFDALTIDAALVAPNAKLPLSTGQLVVSGADSVAAVTRGANGSLSISHGGWNIGLAFQDASGSNIPTSPNGKSVTLFAKANAVISGAGYKPNTSVYIYALSPAQIVGSALTDDKGAFSATIALPAQLSDGLQVNDYDATGKVLSVSYGFDILTDSMASAKFAAKSVLLSTKVKTALARLATTLKATKSPTVVVASYVNTGLASKRVATLIKYLKSLGLAVKKQGKPEKAAKSADQLLLKLSWIR